MGSMEIVPECKHKQNVDSPKNDQNVPVCVCCANYSSLYTHTHTLSHTNRHTHTRSHTQTETHTHTRSHTQTETHTHTCSNTQTDTYTDARTHKQIHTHTHTKYGQSQKHIGSLDPLTECCTVYSLVQCFICTVISCRPIHSYSWRNSVIYFH
jgi:hypothetical protein